METRIRLAAVSAMVFFFVFVSLTGCEMVTTPVNCDNGNCGPSVVTECNDGIDNDGDGLVDYPEDPGCESAGDDDESNSTTTDLAECEDGVDNDGDGLVDYPEDPGCESAGDDDETDPGTTTTDPECADGIDNDGDGEIDYPEDDGCDSPSDDDESDVTTFTDNLGAYYCTTTFADVEAWLLSNGVPEGLYCDAGPCDTDGDTALDVVWAAEVWMHYAFTIPVDMLDLIENYTWTCDDGADGTDDSVDDDGDGYTELAGDCDDGSPGNGPAMPDICGDGFDNNCDGVVDETCGDDVDGDGFTPFTGDCDDDSVFFAPGATEFCNGEDNNCNGIIDDSDADGDGHISEDCVDYDGGLPIDDCADWDANIYTGAPEIGDWVDNNCDTVIDEDCIDPENYQWYYDGDDISTAPECLP